MIYFILVVATFFVFYRVITRDSDDIELPVIGIFLGGFFSFIQAFLFWADAWYWNALGFAITGFCALVVYSWYHQPSDVGSPTVSTHLAPSVPPEPYTPDPDSPEIAAARRQSLAAMKRATEARHKDMAASSKPFTDKTTSFPIAKPNKVASAHFEDFYDKAMDIGLLIEKQPEMNARSNRKSISKPRGKIMRNVDLSGEHSNFNSKLRLDRAADQLIGICSGIASDGIVNKDEVAFLSAWVAEHCEVCGVFPGNLVADRISAIMADGRIGDDELKDLLQTLQQISGNHFIETGAAAPESPVIQADTPDVIEFIGRRFCLTGKFVFGSRTTCEAATTKLGAACSSDVTLQTDYLVIGALVSPDWKHETYGRKIERAMGLRDEGYRKPVIITEEQWAVYIR